MSRLLRPLWRHCSAGRSLLVIIPVCLSIPTFAFADTLGGLAARLDEAIRQVEAARQGGAPLGDPDALFPHQEDVVWRNEVMRLDHGSLRAEWRAVPAEGEPRNQALERLRDRLAAARAELAPVKGSGTGVDAGRQGGRPSVGPGDRTASPEGATDASPPAGWREKLREVLSRPEFGKREAQEPILARLLRWLRDKLALLFPAGAAGAAGTVTRWAIYALAGAAVLLVLVALVRAAMPLLRRDLRGGRHGSAGEGARPEAPETLLALAEGRARAADYRGAVQAVFRWMLLTLHMAGRLEYDAALTNREHLARLKTGPTARAAFEELIRQFELAWYAFRPVGREEYAAFKVRCQQLAEERA